jgi:hypothetical protein
MRREKKKERRKRKAFPPSLSSHFSLLSSHPPR